jgi:Flp pilus assembly protein TadG
MSSQIPTLLATKQGSLRRVVRDSRGSSVVETAIILPVLLLLLAVAVDLGRAFTAAIVTTSAAHAGAIYGSQHPTDVAGMVAAAKLDAGTWVTVLPTAQYGCQCSDGSSAVASCASEPSCPFNSVYYIQLNTSTLYTPLLPYPGLGNGIQLHGKARIRAAR